jgi:hypothetical protein
MFANATRITASLDARQARRLRSSQLKKGEKL